MAVVIEAQWETNLESRQEVLEALEHLAPASRTEPGNLLYTVYQDPLVPTVFRIFEVYTDDDAFAAHLASDHFEKYAISTAIPLLISRQKTAYTRLDI